MSSWGPYSLHLSRFLVSKALMMRLFSLFVAYATAQSTTESPQAALEQVEHEYKSALSKGNETLKSLKAWLEGIESSASKEGEADEVASKIKRLAASEDAVFDRWGLGRSLFGPPFRSNLASRPCGSRGPKRSRSSRKTTTPCWTPSTSSSRFMIELFLWPLVARNSHQPKTCPKQPRRSRLTVSS